MQDYLDAPIIQKIYDFYLDLYLTIEKMPKKDKYSIGIKIENYTLEAMELISRAASVGKSDKTVLLEKAAAKVDITKLMTRLAYDIKAIDKKKYISLEEQLQETGKMIGGWLKYSKQ